MRALVLIIASMATLRGYAQDTPKSLLDAIKDYEDALGITFSFDAELIELANEEALFTSDDLNEFIEEFENQFPVEIGKIDDEYYSITAVETSYRLAVKDSLNGAVIDESFGVQVVVNDTPINTNFKNGAWEFSYTPHHGDEILVYSQGFKTTLITVTELFNEKSLEVYMGLTTRRLNTVIVEDYLTKGINLMPSRQQIQIDVNDLPLLPGETDGDLFTSIAALPGITNPDSRAGNIFIRGSDTDQTLILFDNIPIYHRGHYYGTISPYNPKIVDDVEVYRSGFHPRFGDRVGGAIVINSDEADESSTYGVGANTLFGMAYGKFRISDKWSGALSIRKSYPRSFKSPKLEEISESVFAATSLVDQGGLLTDRIEVGFSDYNGKLSYQLNQNNHLELSTIYTFSDINFKPVTAPDLHQRLNNNRYENAGANLSWKADWNQSWRSHLNVTYSKYDFEFTIKTLAPEVPPFVSHNTIDDLNVVQEFSRKSEYSNLQLGVDFKRQKVSTDYLNILRDSSLYSFAKTVEASTISPYTNYEFFGWSRWYIQLGIRGTYYNELDDCSISPRLLLNYDLTDWMTLKSSHGWYNQFLSQVKNLEYSSGGFDNELWVLADDETGFIIRGTQSMFGGVINTNNKWIFDVEGFYKTGNDITIYEDRRLNPNRGFYTMDQETYGVDVLLKKQVSEATSLWTSYSFNDSKIQIDTTDRVTYKSKYVQPHVWYLGGTYKKNRWKVSAAWRFASGLNAYSLDIAFAESIFKRGPQNPPPPSPPDSPPPPRPPNPFEDVPERYPNVHSLDVSASYKIPQTDQRKWSATFGVSIINALNQANLTDRVYRSRDGFVDREAIGFAPNLMVIVEW